MYEIIRIVFKWMAFLRVDIIFYIEEPWRRQNSLYNAHLFHGKSSLKEAKLKRFENKYWQIILTM